MSKRRKVCKIARALLRRRLVTQRAFRVKMMKGERKPFNVDTISLHDACFNRAFVALVAQQHEQMQRTIESFFAFKCMHNIVHKESLLDYVNTIITENVAFGKRMYIRGTLSYLKTVELFISFINNEILINFYEEWFGERREDVPFICRAIYIRLNTQKVPTHTRLRAERRELPCFNCSEFHFFKMGEIVLPRDIMIEVFSFVTHDYANLRTIGLVCWNWHVLFLSTWRDVVIGQTRPGLRDMPLLSIMNVQHVQIGVPRYPEICSRESTQMIHTIFSSITNIRDLHFSETMYCKYSLDSFREILKVCAARKNNPLAFCRELYLSTGLEEAVVPRNTFPSLRVVGIIRSMASLCSFVNPDIVEDLCISMFDFDPSKVPSPQKLRNVKFVGRYTSHAVVPPQPSSETVGAILDWIKINSRLSLTSICVICDVDVIREVYMKIPEFPSLQRVTIGEILYKGDMGNRIMATDILCKDSGKRGSMTDLHSIRAQQGMQEARFNYAIVDKALRGMTDIRTKSILEGVIGNILIVCNKLARITCGGVRKDSFGESGRPLIMQMILGSIKRYKRLHTFYITGKGCIHGSAQNYSNKYILDGSISRKQLTLRVYDVGCYFDKVLSDFMALALQFPVGTHVKFTTIRGTRECVFESFNKIITSMDLCPIMPSQCVCIVNGIAVTYTR